MYRTLVVFGFAIYIACTLARPAQEQQQLQTAAPTGPTTTTTQATIIKEVNVNNPDGSYNSSYETSNGIKVENAGYMKRVIVPKTETPEGQVLEEHEELILVQQGSYSYMDPDGNVITLRYVADENGFQPHGDHLPMAPQ